ncbi:hypothetical protein HELRODRAFT_190347 [Helobdella robusta]|uniref:HTH OST-type domain-containing protein n=1 Tax=Helobdella robusta TaxID=6412 RepID=T1FRX4_HELRO|nr:hypothetical protein HELRODRAFT_190347 [Helobdella robusta]ESO09983.1 hypothetical protein HELRODRAFT_190347 [Helobdella robusta]
MPSKALTTIPHEHYLMTAFYVDFENFVMPPVSETLILVDNLPLDVNYQNLSRDIEQMFKNGKGKVMYIINKTALVCFPSWEAAFRSKVRFYNECLHGRRIKIHLLVGVDKNKLLLNMFEQSLLSGSTLINGSAFCNAEIENHYYNPKVVANFKKNLQLQLEYLQNKVLPKSIRDSPFWNFGLTSLTKDVDFGGDDGDNVKKTYPHQSSLDLVHENENGKNTISHINNIKDVISNSAANKFVVAQVLSLNNSLKQHTADTNSTAPDTAFSEKVNQQQNYKNKVSNNNNITQNSKVNSPRNLNMDDSGYPSGSAESNSTTCNTKPYRQAVTSSQTTSSTAVVSLAHFHHHFSHHNLSPRSFYSAGNGNSAAFRRTPGARRPALQQQQYLGLNGNNTIEKLGHLKPQPLFSRLSSNAGDVAGIKFKKGKDYSTVFTERSPMRNGDKNSKSISSSNLICTGSKECYHSNNVAVGGIKKGASSSAGINLVVSNLDYNISTHEWKKILSSEFQNVQVNSLAVQMQANNTSIATVNVASLEDARYIVSQFHRKKIGYKRIHVAILNSESTAVTSPQNTIKSDIVSLLSSIPGKRLPLFQFFELFEKRYQKNISILDLQNLRDYVRITDQEGLGKVVLLKASADACSNSSHCNHNNAHNKDAHNHNYVSTPACADVGGSCNELENGINRQESALLAATTLPVYCQRKCCEHTDRLAWIHIDMSLDPKVKLLLRSFSSQLHKLLQCHEGSMPLNSFPACYAREFSPLSLEVSGEGVSLEHLITCVQGVEVTVVMTTGVKKIQWAEKRSTSPIDGVNTAWLSPQLDEPLTQVGHELTELIKSQPDCVVQLNSFSACYQRYFGRQFRCSDFGCADIYELVQSLSHVIQILGSGPSSCLTLTHRAQVKRFSSTLLRILKCQPTKSLNVEELSDAYSKVLDRSLNITEYGVCYVEDLLIELPDALIMIIRNEQGIILSMPRKEKLEEDSPSIKVFIKRYSDLLSVSENYQLSTFELESAFEKKYKYKLDVTNTGMNLLEIFEALPEYFKIVESNGAKYISLSNCQMIQVAEEEFDRVIEDVLNRSGRFALTFNDFLSAYSDIFQRPLKLSAFGVHSISALVSKMSGNILVERRGNQNLLTSKKYLHRKSAITSKLQHALPINSKKRSDKSALGDADDVDSKCLNVLLLIMEFSDGSVAFDHLQALYNFHYKRGGRNEELTIEYLARHMADYVTISKILYQGPTLRSSSSPSPPFETLVKLTPAQMFARDIRLMLLNIPEQQTPMSQLEDEYRNFFKVSLIPASYGQQSLASLIRSISHVVTFDGRLSNWNVCLRPHFRKHLDKSNSALNTKPNDNLDDTARHSFVVDARASSNSCVESFNGSKVHNNSDISATMNKGIIRKDLNNTVTNVNNRNIFINDFKDLLSGPVPSCIPSPILEPQYNTQSFMKLESKKSMQDLLTLTQDEKKGLKTPLCRTPVSELLAFAAQLLPSDVFRQSGLEERSTTKFDKVENIFKNKDFKLDGNDLSTAQKWNFPRSQTVNFYSKFNNLPGCKGNADNSTEAQISCRWPIKSHHFAGFSDPTPLNSNVDFRYQPLFNRIVSHNNFCLDDSFLNDHLNNKFGLTRNVNRRFSLIDSINLFSMEKTSAQHSEDENQHLHTPPAIKSLLNDNTNEQCFRFLPNDKQSTPNIKLIAAGDLSRASCTHLQNSLPQPVLHNQSCSSASQLTVDKTANSLQRVDKLSQIDSKNRQFVNEALLRKDEVLPLQLECNTHRHDITLRGSNITQHCSTVESSEIERQHAAVDAIFQSDIILLPHNNASQNCCSPQRNDLVPHFSNTAQRNNKTSDQQNTPKQHYNTPTRHCNIPRESSNTPQHSNNISQHGNNGISQHVNQSPHAGCFTPQSFNKGSSSVTKLSDGSAKRSRIVANFNLSASS